MSLKPFKFKQFTVAQDRCAMKIGTDGVLLGAWASTENNPNSILDIGAGTGVVALQLAQRSMAETIDAVEIDVDAFEQCTENFENSPWTDRLFCYHASVQEFASEIDEKYDLIVSNPPYFTPPQGEASATASSLSKSRALARYTEALPFQHLLVCAAHLLSENGTFTSIFPKKEEENVTQLALESRLFPNRVCTIKGTPVSEEKRVLIEFSFQKKEPIIETLVIETARHKYTLAYRTLVSDFYLKM